VKSWLLGHLIWAFYRLLSMTWRLDLRETDEMKSRMANRKGFLLAHWHGDEYSIVQFAGRYRIATLVSKSKDGEVMATVFKLLGGEVSRGSSSRGAVGGYLGLIRLLKKGFCSSFAVDGPRGPRFKAKIGIVETAKNFQLPIFFAGVSCDRAWVSKKSWNQGYLPKPFAKLCVVWRGPLLPPPKDSIIDDTWLQKIENELHAAHQQAQGFIAES
jgi:lysophospholipid acyltransferase (LPLAT)-like uncharacterized protein